MDARIGASRAGGFHLAAVQQRERLFQLALHGGHAAFGLACEACERRAVVGDRQGHSVPGDVMRRAAFIAPIRE